MKLQYLMGILVFFAMGCATYKELQPLPEINPNEGQFNTLKNKEENFQLKKDELYFIKFPHPYGNDYFLVLMGESKPLIHSYMKNLYDAVAESIVTRSFGFTDGGIQSIQDLNEKSDSILIYPIDSLSNYYSWMIDTVREDIDLKLSYRYVQQWRYTFENEYARFKSTLKNTTIDRSIYNAIALEYNTDNIDTKNSLTLIASKRKNLQAMREELRQLERVFPPDIKQSSDTAYQTYDTFCQEVDNELTFQNTYYAVLTLFKKEKETRSDIVAFLKAAPEFIHYTTISEEYPRRINEKVKSIISYRLNEIMPYYDAALRKPDIATIGPFPEVDNIEKLYKAYDEKISDDLENLLEFLPKFIEERDAFQIVESNLVNLNAMAENISDRPTDSFYRIVVSVLEQTQNAMPVSEARRVEKYGKYRCAITLDQKITNASKYIKGLVEQVNALRVFDSKLSEINAAFGQTATWPSDTFYTAIVSNLNEVKMNLPKSAPARIDPYSDNKISTWANKRVANAGKEINDQLIRYQKAEVLVPQINSFKAQGNYRNIIRLLAANRSLSFLIDQYPDVDTLSLGTQTRKIAANLNVNAWGAAESKIDDLFRDKDYLNYEAIAEKKNQIVKQYETELFQKVNLTSRSAADTFVKIHETSVKNIQGLYKDSAFIPVYKLIFSSTNPRDVQLRRKLIEDYLNDSKNIRFPETAIKALYRELTKNSRDQGVEKARAIVDHGKFYKGTDKQVKGLVDECDPNIAKSIIKPSEYRRLFVLPISSNKKGPNSYLLRLKLDIPSEAEFPVFDVNIAMSSDLAQNAEQKAWFDEITINKKQIKNEGRFHITAPTSANNYESQITPVQLDKASSNILEIKLTYDELRVFEVSVMAQKPIIRKN